MLTDAYLYVCCDGDDCKNQEEIALTATSHGWDDRNVERAIKREGWTIKKGFHYCPDCSEKGGKQDG